jgi:hypothetical protein
MNVRASAAMALAFLGVPPAADAQPSEQHRAALGSRGAGVLGIMGFDMTPDGLANAVQIDCAKAGGEEGDPTLTLSQFGFGFTALWVDRRVMAFRSGRWRRAPRPSAMP